MHRTSAIADIVLVLSSATFAESNEGTVTFNVLLGKTVDAWKVGELAEVVCDDDDTFGDNTPNVDICNNTNRLLLYSLKMKKNEST